MQRSALVRANHLSWTVLLVVLLFFAYRQVVDMQRAERVNAGLALCEILPETTVDSLRGTGEFRLGYKTVGASGRRYTILQVSRRASERDVPLWVVELIEELGIEKLRIENRLLDVSLLSLLSDVESLKKLDLLDCDIVCSRTFQCTFAGDVTFSGCRFAPDVRLDVSRATKILLAGSVLTELQFIEIGESSSLVRAFVADSPIPDRALDSLLDSKKLESLWLCRQPLNRLSHRAEGVEKNHSVKSLYLDDCSPCAGVAQFLGRFDRLTHCMLQGESACLPSVEALSSSHETLLELLLTGRGVTDECLPALKRLPELRKLMIRDTSLSSVAVQEFAQQFSGHIEGQM